MPIYTGNTKINPSGYDKIYIGNSLIWQKGPTGPTELCLESVNSSGANIYFEGFRLTETKEMYYSVNSRNNWNSYTLTLDSSTSIYTGQTISLQQGDKCYFKGIGFNFDPSKTDGYITIKSSGNIKPSGHVKSLLSLDMSRNELNIGELCGLFNGCPITEVPLLNDLIVDSYGLKNMFKDCNLLTSTSDLSTIAIKNTNSGGLVMDPITSMFENCTSLTNVSNIPYIKYISGAYVTGNYFCNNIFKGCSSLATVDSNLFLNSFSEINNNFYFGGGAFANTILNASFDLTHITKLSLANGFISSNSNNIIAIHFGTNLTDINSSTVFNTTPFYTGYLNIYYHFTNNDTPQFTNINWVVSKGSNKATLTYNIYTDNTAIKNAALSQVDQYTIVNVYHLDGSAWE